MNVWLKTAGKFLSLLLLLAMLAGCSESPEPTEMPTEPPVTEEYVEQTEPAQEDLVIVRDGVSEFRIIYGANASDEVKDAARQIRQEILRLTGVELPMSEDLAYSPKKDTWEILVGSTDREEDDRSFSQLIFAGDYLVCPQDRKLTVAANLTESLSTAVMELLDVLSELTVDGDLVLPATFRISGGTEGDASALIPAFTGGALMGVCDGGNGTALLVYEADSDDCDEYLQRLSQGGFHLRDQNEIDGNRYFTFLGEGMTVTVMDNPALGTVRMAVDPAELPVISEAEPFETLTTPSVTMLGLEGYNTSGTPNQNGLSLLYQLSDGSFIVVDGGHNVYLAARQLYSKMVELAPDPRNITIAAWIITHSHNDHAGAFLRFAESYSQAVKLEKLIVNFPGDGQYATSGTGTTYKTRVLDYVKLYKDTTVIKAHPGQLFRLRDAEIQVLYTLELYEPAVLTDFNSSSIVCTVTLGGQKLMQTGDCGIYSSSILTTIYSDALKSDILQVSHHGYQGGTEELYRAVDPSYVLWPSGSQTYENYKGAANNVWLLTQSNMRKLWVARYDIYTLKLPISDEN